MNSNNKLAIGGLMWSQTLYLGSAFETWFPIIATTGLASLIVFRDHRRSQSIESIGRRTTPNRNPDRVVRNGITTSPGKSYWPSDGFWIALATPIVLAISLFWRLASQSDADVNVLSVAIDGAAHAALFCSLLVWTWRPNRGHTVMLGLGLLVLLFGAAAGGISRSMAAQTSIALTACIGFVIATQVIQGTARGNRFNLLGSGSGVDQRTKRMTRIVSLTAISMLLMTTGVIASATNWALPTLQQAIQQQLSESLDVIVQTTGIGGTRYVRSGRLGAVRDHLTANPTEVALVVESDSRPGYLRGRVYDLYRRQRWISARDSERTATGMRGNFDRAISPVGDGQVDLKYRSRRARNRFLLPTQDATDAADTNHAHLVVYNDPTKGYVVFTPLTTRWIEANSNLMLLGDHDVVGPGIDITSPYVVGVGRQPRIDILSDEQRATLTQVPSPVRSEAKKLAAEICPDGGSARKKAAQVSRYFQSQWDYSLIPTEAPKGVDPIAYFLRQRHPAHCEYFASATTAILRQLNVPSRYVTGYVVDELEEEKDDLWLARNQDAHAWVEAYDELTNRWFAVESTPGRTYQTVSPIQDGGAGNALTDGVEDDSDAESDSLLGRAWVWLVSLRATDALLFLYQVSLFPLFLFLVAYWWIKFRQPANHVLEGSDRKSLRMLNKVDRTLRKHSLYRAPSETLCQFADRIESHATAAQHGESETKLRGIANWYRQYAFARYRGRVPQPLDVR